MTPERIAELQNYAGNEHIMPPEIRDMADAIASLRQTVTTQQREIDGLYGLLITKHRGEGLGLCGFEVYGHRELFPTEELARAAVRSKWQK